MAQNVNKRIEQLRAEIRRKRALLPAAPRFIQEPIYRGTLILSTTQERA